MAPSRYCPANKWSPRELPNQRFYARIIKTYRTWNTNGILNRHTQKNTSTESPDTIYRQQKKASKRKQKIYLFILSMYIYLGLISFVNPS